MQSGDNRLDDLLARRGELLEQLRHLAEAPEGSGNDGAALGTAMVRTKIAGLDAQIAELRGRNG
jgi:hypothetical protein